MSSGRLLVYSGLPSVHTFKMSPQARRLIERGSVSHAIRFAVANKRAKEAGKRCMPHGTEKRL